MCVIYLFSEVVDNIMVIRTCFNYLFQLPVFNNGVNSVRNCSKVILPVCV
jgi:hypothetical protein